jgi:lysozyme family protein
MQTSFLIRDWGDGYVALKHRAEDVRGRVDFTLTPTGDLEDAAHWQHWPRTTGADALVIAAFPDPHVQRLALRHDDSAAAEQRWRRCLDELAHWALAHPDGEYVDNRRFWSCVVTVCVQLSSSFAPLPAQAEWDAVLAAIGDDLRNGVPPQVPFGPFQGVTGYLDLYLAQLQHLAKVRGMDRRAPEPGMTGGVRVIPRTTLADVKQLVAFWSVQLNAVKKIIEHESVAQKWNAAVADLEALSKRANPDAIYVNNHALWRALAKVATQVEVADRAPSTGARIFDSIQYGVTQVPATLGNSAKAVASGAVAAVGEAASGVAQLAGSAFKGLLSGLGAPAVLGGGLLGAWLLLRARAAKAEA